jgi:hypothetical protein
MSDKPDKPSPKRAAELLKETLAARKAAHSAKQGPLRADFGKAKVQPDAERRAGKSRKVH